MVVDTAPKRRGRPLNSASPKTREADATIARTVWQLLAWGYPLRSEVAEVVGKLARSELYRTGHGSKDLGPDQIEKIFEGWFRDQQKRTEGGSPPARPWNRISILSLRKQAPTGVPLVDVARALMRNHGTWPSPQELPGHILEEGDGGTLGCGDPILTRKAQEEYQRNKLRWVGSRSKTG